MTSAKKDGILVAMFAKDSQLYVGTSSWTGDGWVGAFYPEGTKPADFLQYYAGQFNCVEIDSTFYRIPTAKTVEQWRERTPNGFVFAAKAPSSITHQKVLVEADDDLNQFLRVMDLLGDKLGPIIWQFPYMNRQRFRGLGFFIERLEPWLKKLPKNYQWVVEVRNKGWLSEKLYSVLRRHGVALAMIDHPWMPRPDEVFNTGDPVTADFTYIRWLGDHYGIEERTKVWDKTIIDRTAELTEWVRIMRGLESRGIRIYAFANNHWSGQAPATVNTFRRLWSATEPAKRKQPADQHALQLLSAVACANASGSGRQARRQVATLRQPSKISNPSQSNWVAVCRRGQPAEPPSPSAGVEVSVRLVTQCIPIVMGTSVPMPAGPATSFSAAHQ